MDKKQMNNQIDDYTEKGQEYLQQAEEKANELLSKVNGVAHDVVDKTTDMKDDMNNVLKKKTTLK